jgi:hypothetical protein
MFSSCPEWVFPQANFVYKLDPKDGFSIAFFFYWNFFAKREIQIQKVSDYVGFQSPELNSRNFVSVKLPDFYIGFSFCSQIYKDE